jgi:PadR family transcriptional regulator, regulatory protein PadR
MGDNKSEVLQGTLDLMVLKTLETMSPLHGYGIARRIEQVSGDSLVLNQGTIYPALLRLEQRGWITILVLLELNTAHPGAASWTSSGPC